MLADVGEMFRCLILTKHPSQSGLHNGLEVLAIVLQKNRCSIQTYISILFDEHSVFNM